MEAAVEVAMEAVIDPSNGGRRLHLAAAIGNALEWFDFAVYGYFANDIGKLFFPPSDPALQLIVGFGIFAVGYLMRPIGSLLLGPVGDWLGRRTMLLVSVLVMGGCSLLIGLLPTYASWGASATYALLALRMLQGLSVGGEYTGSITYVVESSAVERRGWRSAVTASGSIVGFVAGAVAAALVYSLLSPQAVLLWGWRIPFLAGAVVALLGFWLRSANLPGAAPVQAAVHGLAPFASPGLEAAGLWLGGFWRHRGLMLRVMAAISFPDVVFYMLLVGLLQYAIGQAPGLAGAFTTLTAINELIGVGFVLLGGLLSDRYGALHCMRWACLVLALTLMPGYLLVQQASVIGVMVGELLILVPLMIICGAYPALLPIQFPEGFRCTGFSLAYSLVVALLGGTAPLLGSWMLMRLGWNLGPAFYTLIWLPVCFWGLRGLSGTPSQAQRLEATASI